MHEHPKVPVYWVEVKGHRALSQEIAGRLGIVHESPQAILLRRGTPVWHASHAAVTASAIGKALLGLPLQSRDRGAHP